MTYWAGLEISEELGERWEELRKDGYTLLRTPDARSLLCLASELGVPMPSRPGQPLVAELRPELSHAARTSSMTSRFGLHSFPLHTDGAFLRSPPRFLILRCKQDSVGGRPTVILDPHPFIADRLCDQLRTHLWLVDVRPAFYCSLVQDIGDSSCLRWDPNILKPAHRSARSTTDDFRVVLKASCPISIKWEPTLTLVVDNWRLLHARADRPEGVRYEDRVLQRVLVATT